MINRTLLGQTWQWSCGWGLQGNFYFIKIFRQTFVCILIFIDNKSELVQKVIHHKICENQISINQVWLHSQTHICFISLSTVHQMKTFINGILISLQLIYLMWQSCLQIEKTEKLMQHSMKTLEFLLCRTGLVVWNLLLLCGIIWSTLLDCHNSGWTIDFANGFSLWHNQTLMQQLLCFFVNWIYQKTESCHDANFIIIGDIRGCHNDNLWCHQWWQSWHHDNSLFSVFTV